MTAGFALAFQLIKSSGSRPEAPAFGLRRSRYIGVAKTRLQPLATEAAINLKRVSDWLAGIDREKTRRPAFACVMRLLTAQSLIALIMEFANSIQFAESSL
jgi:hypothetical protein